MDKNQPYYDPYNFNINQMPQAELTPGIEAINPAMYYEQQYMYYRYLTQMLEYKTRLKEYERLSKEENK